MPTFAADTFTLAYKGDLVGLFPAQDATNPATDPFALAGGSPSVNVVFNAGNDTTDLIFSGNPIGPGTSVTTGPVTFGVDTGTNLPGRFDLAGAAWSNSSTMQSQSVSAIGITIMPNLVPPPPPGPIILTLTDADGHVTEYLILPGQPNTWQIEIANPTPDDETLANVGYYLSPTQIPLDDLNPSSLPPPDFPGSPFIPLPSLDGTTLGPGQSITVTVPEPSALALTAAGAGLGLLWLRRRAGPGPPSRAEGDSEDETSDTRDLE